MDLAVQIDALLPQTQCARCGYPGCLPYAQAVAQGQAEINQCPPGGQKTVDALAHLLKRPAVALNPDFGRVPEQRMLAVIEEEHCIGCTLCIQACPLDAIIGAAKLMHTVLLEECSGCELCLPPCPVDCIQMVAVSDYPHIYPNWTRVQAKRAKQRFLARQKRLESACRDSRHETARTTDPRKALIAEALTRVKRKKALSAGAEKSF